ncbi:MerR family transcriptional regulator [Eikenella sp. S3360]|uniref:MerR family transcriptional regulator n=1 Tax=Eikenella glucosivorans TaxID=2766967 RepID=A0ABS0ND39_9NEIS|nr:MerR family transcriptional regulator [Eikenella glucosivorans]MBH5330246.1 MerR family transcriptional regulator [Eikenella glucosivorans]
MQIKQFSEQTGLSIHTLRYYEKEGLLRPERDALGRRAYGSRDAEWVGFILRLKEMGVPLAQIKEYARLRHQGEATVPARHALLRAHRDVLLARQRELAAHQAFLESKLALYEEMMGQGAAGRQAT